MIAITKMENPTVASKIVCDTKKTDRNKNGVVKSAAGPIMDAGALPIRLATTSVRIVIINGNKEITPKITDKIEFNIKIALFFQLHKVFSQKL